MCVAAVFTLMFRDWEISFVVFRFEQSIFATSISRGVSPYSMRIISALGDEIFCIPAFSAYEEESVSSSGSSARFPGDLDAMSALP